MVESILLLVPGVSGCMELHQNPLDQGFLTFHTHTYAHVYIYKIYTHTS
jgi:hypothetical protein